MAQALVALATASLEIARRLGCAQDDPLMLALCEAPRAEEALAQYVALGSADVVVTWGR